MGSEMCIRDRIKFYISTGLLLAVVLATIFVSTFMANVGVFLLVFVLLFTMTIYFRLLGRLAWVLDQDPIKLPGDEAPSEDDAELVEA